MPRFPTVKGRDGARTSIARGAERGIRDASPVTQGWLKGAEAAPVVHHHLKQSAVIGRFRVIRVAPPGWRPLRGRGAIESERV